jgi:hypothetical protein
VLPGFFITYLLMIKNLLPRQMSDKDLSNFLKKIEQLNQIAELIKNNPSKKLSLSKCKNHDEVIKLTTEWGFDIGKRWGEY